MMICRLEVERMVFSYLIYMLMVNFVIFGYFAGWKVLNLKLEPKEYMKDVNFVRPPLQPSSSQQRSTKHNTANYFSLHFPQRLSVHHSVRTCMMIDE